MSELSYPENLLYHPEHTWLRIESDGSGVVGISDFAQDQLGEVAFVDLPAVGASFAAGKEFGTVESVKAVNALFMPISGTVTAANDALSSDPSLVNVSPYGDGWMLKITLAPDADKASLLSNQNYANGLKR